MNADSLATSPRRRHDSASTASVSTATPFRSGAKASSSGAGAASASRNSRGSSRRASARTTSSMPPRTGEVSANRTDMRFI